MWKWLTDLIAKVRGKSHKTQQLALVCDTSQLRVVGTAMLLRSWNRPSDAGAFELIGGDSVPRRLRVAFPGVNILSALSTSFALTGVLVAIAENPSFATAMLGH